MLKWILTFFCVLFSIPVGAVAQSIDIAAEFQQMRDSLALLPVDAETQSGFDTLIDFAEAQSANELIDFAAVGALMDSIVLQLASVALEIQTGGQAAPAVVPVQDDDGEILDLFIQSADRIKAALFFAAGDLTAVDAPSPEPPPGHCSVTLLARTVGPLLSDPGGQLHIFFAGTVALEARPNREGGAYEWELEQSPEEKFFVVSGNRFSYRALDSESHRVTVTYTSPTDQQCQDSIWIRVQGQFPDN